jgi:hypothetical protein
MNKEVLEFAKELHRDYGDWKEVFAQVQKSFQLDPEALEELRKELNLGVGEVLGVTEEVKPKEVADYHKEVNKSAAKAPDMTFKGLPIKLEYEQGDVKEGKDPVSGKPFQITYKYPYGEILNTEGDDKDPVDIYLGPDPDSLKVFVVHQLTPDGKSDEDKVFLGFDSSKEAEQAYREHGPKWGFGSIEEMHWDQFKNGYLVANRDLPASTEAATLGDVTDRTEHMMETRPEDTDLARGGSMEVTEQLEAVMRDVLYVLDKSPNNTISRNDLMAEVFMMYEEPLPRGIVNEAIDYLITAGKVVIDPTAAREMVHKVSDLKQTFATFSEISKRHGMDVASQVFNKVRAQYKLPEVIEIPVDVSKNSDQKKVASLVDEILSSCRFSSDYLDQTASFFTYDWDSGSPWKVTESEKGMKRLVRQSLPEKKSSIVSSLYRVGSEVTCVAGIYPYPCIIREVLGEGRYRIQSTLSGHVTEVEESDLTSDTQNLF